mmetsp:Transcript_35785/g.71219  ORF Transcript_35785/g.71219 Transcript_35785/m.71219 type:complete len:214 (-) Transcript_35785:274-915(-)
MESPTNKLNLMAAPGSPSPSLSRMAPGAAPEAPAAEPRTLLGLLPPAAAADAQATPGTKWRRRSVKGPMANGGDTKGKPRLIRSLDGTLASRHSTTGAGVVMAMPKPAAAVAHLPISTSAATEVGKNFDNSGGGGKPGGGRSAAFAPILIGEDVGDQPNGVRSKTSLRGEFEALVLGVPGMASGGGRFPDLNEADSMITSSTASAAALPQPTG